MLNNNDNNYTNNNQTIALNNWIRFLHVFLYKNCILQIKVIGLLELNSNNNEEIQREAANIRKAKFLRALAKQYVY